MYLNDQTVPEIVLTAKVPPHSHPFDALTPDVILAALEQVGLRPDGRLLALNSYENRVYQAGIEDQTPMVVKFYRPQRWPLAAIEEEHRFAFELQAADVPVVAPRCFAGCSLLQHAGFAYAIYPRQGGRWPELGQESDWQWLGRFLGRIHALGRRQRFQHRPALNIQQWAVESRRYLLAEGWIPEHIEAAYRSVTQELIEKMQLHWQSVAWQPLRIHGDCHLGNVLWNQGPHFVDLDDCLMGPALQDLWMLLSGTPTEQAQQLQQLLEGYGQFADFNWGELALLETLRTLRLMNYAAWLARRWSDPAFPRAFPWFTEHKFWENHMLDLREQLAALDEPPLTTVEKDGF